MRNRKKTIRNSGVRACIVAAAFCLAGCTGSAANQLAVQLGQKYLENGKYGKAAAAFEKAREADPEELDTYTRLIEAYGAMEDAKSLETVIGDAMDMLLTLKEEEKTGELAQKLDSFAQTVTEYYTGAEELPDSAAIAEKAEELKEAFPEDDAAGELAALFAGKEDDAADAGSGWNGDWEQLPRQFVFSSGVGAWGTEIELGFGGSFTGEYHDSEMGSTGDGYPNGTRYICRFSGQFSQPEKRSEFCYVMKLESLTVEDTADTEWISDGIRYIASDPYGFDDADEFYLYLPGMPVSEMEEGFLSWAFLNTEIRKTLPSGFYGIYNVNGEEGFVGFLDSVLWNRDYLYEYGSGRSELWPSYSNVSHLLFWPENGAASVDLSFPWQEDDQTEFDAVDSRSGGSCHLSLSFSEDQSTVVVTISDASGIDLSAWGGTADGQFSAEYRDKNSEQEQEQEPVSTEAETFEIHNEAIPESALEWEGHYYACFDNGSSWKDAEDYCSAAGGHLATISSPEENEAVFGYLQTSGYESAYFGFTDSGEEGSWHWVNGETSDYTNWHRGEPNSENSGEDYAMFYFKYKDGSWNDGDFGNSTVKGGTVYICEWESSETSQIPVADTRSLDEIIQEIRAVYYEIQEQQENYSQSGVDGLFRWYFDDDQVLRKAVLYPGEKEQRENTEEFYYNDDGTLAFAFVYSDSGDEYRYYFYEGWIYRYMKSDEIYDYPEGEDPGLVFDAQEIRAHGWSEQHYAVSAEKD